MSTPNPTDAQPPIVDENGSASCPRCGRSLTYVERVIERREYPIDTLIVEADMDDETSHVFFPQVSTPSDLRVIEVLNRRVECSALDCTYLIPDACLGETDFN